MNLSQAATTLDPKIREISELIQSENYVLTETSFTEKQINEEILINKVKNLTNNILEPFKKSLNESNNEIFVKILIQNIISKVEKASFQIKFNQLGALQFSKDIRLITSFFSSITESSVRGDFSRLSNISSILNFEKVEDIYDYWGNSSEISWRLTSQEVRKILSNRIDFSSEVISKLIFK